MLVVMHSHATPEQIDQVLAAVKRMNLTAHAMPGATRTAIGITGNLSAVDPRSLEVLPGVLELIRVTKPYKLASREMHREDTYVRIPLTPNPSPLSTGERGAQETPRPTGERGAQETPRPTGERGRGEGVVIGPGTFTIIGGPCSVENEDMILRTAEFLLQNGVRLMRAGAFKPRSSPYAFQGLGLEGLDILARVSRQDGDRHRHRADGHRQRRCRRGGGGRHPDRHAQHAELQSAAARQSGVETGAVEARHRAPRWKTG